MGQAAKVTASTKLALELASPDPQKPTIDWKRALENTRRPDASAPYTGPIACKARLGMSNQNRTRLLQ